MREIKFRVPFVTGGFAYFDCLRQVSFEYNNSEHFLWQEAQQYTGLKDKRGVEIYEGDIIHFGLLEDVEYTVVYEPTEFIAINSQKHKLCLVTWQIEVEVVGNIYGYNM